MLTGISVGGHYALIAIGYTMVYGILRLINFAHGDIFMMAGYFMIFAMSSLPWQISIPIVILWTILLGFPVERAAYAPLRTAPRMSIMISAIGVSYLLQNLDVLYSRRSGQALPDIPCLSISVAIVGSRTKRVTVITPSSLFLVVPTHPDQPHQDRHGDARRHQGL